MNVRPTRVTTRICALDLSLAATGYARNDTYGADDGSSSGVIPPTKLTGIPRLRYLRERVLDIADGADLVVLEGYAFARANQAHQLGELGGVIRVALMDRGQPYTDVPPANLKLFACGRGNATKQEMLGAAIRKLGYERNDHNEADALWLLEIATCGVGLSIAANDAQRRALAKITWPEGVACAR